MATLIVRKLDDELVQRLKRRAAEHGRSAEAEHRAILEETLRPAMTGAALVEALSSGPKLTEEEWAEFEAALKDLDQPFEPPHFD